MSVPKVSYIIRTKNEAKFLGKVLDIVYDQTYNDFEVIIVDSGSTDGTLDIIKEYPTKLIKISPKEFHFSYALNLGISKSKGKYICIISGHSIPISRTWLADALEHFKDSNIACVCGPAFFSPLGYIWPGFVKLLLKATDRKRDHYAWMSNTNAIVRRDLWEKYPFDEKLPKISCEDYDWGPEMLARGYNVIRVPEFGVFHSHSVLGRPWYFTRAKKWKKVTPAIAKRKRPRRSFSRLSFV